MQCVSCLGDTAQAPRRTCDYNAAHAQPPADD